MDTELLNQLLTDILQSTEPLTDISSNISQLLEVCQYILFGIGFIGGSLIARALSWWKW